MKMPIAGLQSIKAEIDNSVLKDVRVELVRTFDQFQHAATVRSIAYIAGQSCPFEEEFDGNDFSASHLVAYLQGQPVATIRMRWFAGFAKLERLCVVQGLREKGVAKVIIAYALELAAKKGYQTVIAQIQSRLWEFWNRVVYCEKFTNRQEFSFSDYNYCEIEISVERHTEPITKWVDPYTLIRPEGYWDEPGVLDHSASRSTTKRAA
ncbi:MAG: GNAT family N-acetyltransferase [Pseudomonadota bacterium]